MNQKDREFNRMVAAAEEIEALKISNRRLADDVTNLNCIIEIVRNTPNDSDLGKRVRSFITKIKGSELHSKVIGEVRTTNLKDWSL